MTLVLGAAFFGVALLYSTVGHAGASGYLAAMALAGVSASLMKPTSLTLNVVVATIATIQFARAGHFSWRLFWPFAAASVPAAFLGGRAALPAEVYGPLVGAVLLFSAWRLAATARSERAQRVDAAETRPPKVGVALGVGAALGLLSGLTGTGGGIFLSPLVLLMGWATARRTAAVSAAFILMNSVSGLAGLVSAGRYPGREALGAMAVWAACVVAGGLIGSRLGARKLETATLRRLLAAVLVVAGAKLVMTAIG
jgi:uncharacterized membrane protein YfcA